METQPLVWCAWVAYHKLTESHLHFLLGNRIFNDRRRALDVSQGAVARHNVPAAVVVRLTVSHLVFKSDRTRVHCSYS